MTTHHRSTKPKTRSEFNLRLQSLSARNEELEESLRKAEETCQEYKAKSKAQDAIVQDLLDTIHSLTVSPSDDNESSGGGEKDTKIPEKLFLLLTKSARRVSDLSDEVEEMKSRLKKQTKISNSARENCVDDDDESEHDEDDAEFVDISLSDNENDYMRCGTAPSFSSPQPPVSGQETIKLEEELVRISSKCKSLERSLTTLKRKSAERELRSMKSLRNMRHQVETLEQERRRRLNLQTEAEERALELEIELIHLKQENHRQDIFRRPESADNNSIMREGKQIESDTLAKNGVDDCREAIMLRNHQEKNLFPPLLLVVSEESEGSEDSQESEDDFRPCVNGAVTSE